MISRNTLRYSIETVNQLGNANVVVIPGSIVSQLNEAVAHPFPETVKVNEGEDHFTEATISMSEEILPGMSSNHNILMGELTETFSDILFKRIVTLHDHVVPFVSKVISETNARVVTSLPTVREIIPVKYHELYRHPYFVALLSDFGTVEILDATTLSGLAERDIGEIADLLDTGNPSLNHHIVELVSTRNESWLNEIYQTYFRAGEPTKINTRFNPIEAFGLVEEMTVVYLIARALQARQIVDPGITMPQSQYELALAELVNAAGATVKRSLAQIETSLKNGTVIAFDDKPQNTVYVLEENYNIFLVNGGTPEALFGALLESNWPSINSFTSLTERKDELSARYTEYYTRLLQDVKNSFVERLRVAFIEVFTDNLVTAEDRLLTLFNLGGQIDEETHTVTGVDRNVISQYAVDLGNNIYHHTQYGNDVASIIRELIVGDALAHLNFSPILEEMERVTHEKNAVGEEITPREACFYAVVLELVTHLVKTNLTADVNVLPASED